MKCLICKNGETNPGYAAITFERDGKTLILKNVPARVCNNCGEEYFDESITEEVMNLAEEVFQSGVQLEIREYVSV